MGLAVSAKGKGGLLRSQGQTFSFSKTQLGQWENVTRHPRTVLFFQGCECLAKRALPKGVRLKTLQRTVLTSFSVSPMHSDLCDGGNDGVVAVPLAHQVDDPVRDLFHRAPVYSGLISRLRGEKRRKWRLKGRSWQAGLML